MIDKTTQILFNTVAGFGFLFLIGVFAVADRMIKDK